MLCSPVFITLGSGTRSGHVECARLLVQFRAPMNKRDKGGQTALGLATLQGMEACVLLLQQLGGTP